MAISKVINNIVTKYNNVLLRMKYSLQNLFLTYISSFIIYFIDLRTFDFITTLQILQGSSSDYYALVFISN